MPKVQSKSAPRMRRPALAVALLAGTALGGFAIGTAGFAQSTPANAPAPAPVNAPAATQAVQPALPDFVNLVKQVRPAVVSITTKMQMSQADSEGPMPMPFNFGQLPGMMMHPQMHEVEARGSGFIVDANGTIVTNNHVVKNEKSVTVTLSDGTQLPAHVVGTDPRSDLAVLKIDAGHKLPYIQLGDSGAVEPGQWVVAMGNPFGLGGTVTAGIVSARGRDIGDGPYDQFLQIDAPINQGNSGGPLFTQDGKVVGVNTAILSPSGGSIGIGFAIPSDTVKTVIAQLESSDHRVTRGYIGVQAQKIVPTMAKALGLPNGDGALIAGVEPDSPAAHVGILPGDVIEQVNGQRVENPRDLAVDVSSNKPGQDVKLDVIRNGGHQAVTIKVAELPGDQQTADLGQNESSSPHRLGVALEPLTADLRNSLGVPRTVDGAVIAQVQPGSPAANAGIQEGDVIVGVGTQVVTSPDQAMQRIRAAGKGHAVALRIIRNGKPVFVAVNLDKNADEG